VSEGFVTNGGSKTRSTVAHREKDGLSLKVGDMQKMAPVRRDERRKGGISR